MFQWQAGSTTADVAPVYPTVKGGSVSGSATGPGARSNIVWYGKAYTEASSVEKNGRETVVPMDGPISCEFDDLSLSAV